jgi:cytochrome c oxidase cbb3-type subunit 3
LADIEHPHYDELTGKTTTGHDWDGISELNTPLPRWWLYTLYATIVWALVYWFLYPAIPLLGGSTKGLLGWSSRGSVDQALAGLQLSRGPMNERLLATPIADIEKSPDLLSFARAEGSAIFSVNCVPCHGAGAAGSKGYPNLNDDDWLWGGSAAAIAQTITHGVRWTADSETRASAMPAFGRDGILKPQEIETVVNFVRSLSGLPTEQGADLAAGKAVYEANCAVCHGPEGKGNRDLGAPNLSDAIWLYGSDKASLVARVRNGGGGVMPAWGARLDPASIKAVTVYVHTLGGGE